MANYNPHQPDILGQEFVPIRNEDVQFSQFATTHEIGYRFIPQEDTVLETVNFYINQFPEGYIRDQCVGANIYVSGDEEKSGPVRSVIIPCNAGGVTGTLGQGGNLIAYTGTFPTNAPVEQCVYNPSANAYVSIFNGSRVTSPVQGSISFFFAVNNYASLLAGKRILGVRALTTVSYENETAAPVTPTNFFDLRYGGKIYFLLANDALNTRLDVTSWNGRGPLCTYPPLVVSNTPDGEEFRPTNMGSADVAYGVVGNPATASPNIGEWTYAELQRFEESHPNRLFLRAASYWGAEDATYGYTYITYVALQVFYCEETRIARGVRMFNGFRQDGGAFSRWPYTYGMNSVVVRSPGYPTEGATVLTAGTEYLVTLSAPNTGDDQEALVPLYTFATPLTTPQINATRPLYTDDLPAGVQVNIPYPLNDDAVGAQITVESTTKVPQLSLHDETDTVIDSSHVYGRQGVIDIGTGGWRTNDTSTLPPTNSIFQQVARQSIDDRSMPSRQWPWVRYYARHWGPNLNDQLILRGYSPTVSGSSVIISAAELEALTEIVDGWREVNLQFDTPPTMGDGTVPTWEWYATDPLPSVGNAAPQGAWQVLAASAPALSGVGLQMPANIQFGQVPSQWAIAGATYGTPVSGAVIGATWAPQSGPYVSGATFDPSTDAVLLFAQGAPVVSGFSLSVMSQAITGIGQDCGFDPCGIPTHILYNQLTWTPILTLEETFSTLGASGWGEAPNDQIWTTYPLRMVDDFNRTEAGTWGVPTGGTAEAAYFQQPWETGENTAGGTVSVTGGEGVHTLTAADGVVEVTQRVFLDFFTINLEIEPDSGGFVNRVVRGPTEIQVDWDGGGTATISIVDDGVTVAGPTTVPGITASERMALRVTFDGTYVVAWAADAASPHTALPTIVGVVALRSKGALTLATDASGASLPADVRFYDISIMPTSTAAQFSVGADGAEIYLNTQAAGIDPLTSTNLLPPTAMAALPNYTSPNLDVTMTLTVPATVAPEDDWILVLNEGFDRTETDIWGNPNEGPTWIPTTTSADVDLSVAAGSGSISLTSPSVTGSLATGFVIRRATDSYNGIEVTDLRPSATPAGGPIAGEVIYHPTDTQPYRAIRAGVSFATDGTATAYILTANVSNGPPVLTSAPVTGITTSQPVDIYIEVADDVSMWFAPSSVGIDFDAAPQLTHTWVGSSTAHPIVFQAYSPGGTLTTPLAMLFGAIAIIESPVWTASNEYPLTHGRLARLVVDQSPDGTGANANVPIPLPRVLSAGPTTWRLRFQVFNGVARGKIWPISGSEPAQWLPGTVTDDDTDYWNNPSQPRFEFYTEFPPETWIISDLTVNPVTDINTITHEIQRRDEIDTDWQTICLSTDPYLQSFNDYEARVGIQTWYRIRRLSIYDFPGEWSEELTVTLASPGVSGSCLSGDGQHVLIFTTNEHQDGRSNLAYSEAWQGQVEEGFSFSEASFVQLQPMYDRDFVIAFHSTERGGDQFTRDILVQAAAIAPPTLPGFQSLRDMAWANVPYVCVRDEDGNRWFANVTVPSGRVVNRRRLYMAQVQITEVTDTPSPVGSS